MCRSWLVLKFVPDCLVEEAYHLFNDCITVVDVGEVVGFRDQENLRETTGEEFIISHDLIGTFRANPVSISESKSDWEGQIRITQSIRFGCRMKCKGPIFEGSCNGLLIVALSSVCQTYESVVTVLLRMFLR